MGDGEAMAGRVYQVIGARVSRVGRHDSLYNRCKTVARRVAECMTVASVVQSERTRMR